MRLSYEESFALMKERVDIMGEPRSAVGRPPRHDDEEMGPTIFRTMVEDVALDDLTLPGLYVGHSEITNVSWQRADLHLSTFNWSDVVACNFRGSDLSGADLRACRFERCDFKDANLGGADLRGSTFEACSFENAILRGAKFKSTDQRELRLSREQSVEVIWSVEARESGGG